MPQDRLRSLTSLQKTFMTPMPVSTPRCWPFPPLSGWLAIRSGESLHAKAASGAFWLGLGSASDQILRFGKNIVLTRLLAPEAFGTMAIVLSVTAMMQAFSELGIRDALIQNARGSEPGYVGAAWWLGVGRAVAMYAVVFMLAPWLAEFYGSAPLVPLLRLTAVSMLLDGAVSARLHVALKTMDFRRAAIVTHGGGICGAIATVALSFYRRDVWALAMGLCVESGARCTLSYVLCAFQPFRRLDVPALRDLLQFTRGVCGLSVLNLIFSRTDMFVLGKLFTPSALGPYAMGVLLAQTPMTFIMNIQGQILMPLFSRMQADRRQVNDTLIAITSFAFLIGAPAVAFVFLCGRSLLAAVYGHEYAAAGAPFQVAAGVALVNIVNGQITAVFGAAGRPQLHRRAVASMAVVMIVSIYPMAKAFGLAGAQAACLLAVVMGYLLQLARVRTLTQINLRAYLSILPAALATAAVVPIAYLAAQSCVRLTEPVHIVAAGACACCSSYVLAMWLCRRRYYAQYGMGAPSSK